MKSDENGLIIGMPAPGISAQTSSGERFQLADLAGKELVLLFYPKDHTPICAKELYAFQDAYSAFQKKDVAIVGIGAGDLESHRLFSEKLKLSYFLLCDPDAAIAKSYGVYHEAWWRKCLHLQRERASFLIDHKGFVRRIWRNVKVKGHVEEVMYALDLIRAFRDDSSTLPQLVLPRCAQ